MAGNGGGGKADLRGISGAQRGDAVADVVREAVCSAVQHLAAAHAGRLRARHCIQRIYYALFDQDDQPSCRKVKKAHRQNCPGQLPDRPQYGVEQRAG
ncbi:hypothetical protein D3C77_638310 [compost metagenome]